MSGPRVFQHYAISLSLLLSISDKSCEDIANYLINHGEVAVFLNKIGSTNYWFGSVNELETCSSTLLSRPVKEAFYPAIRPMPPKN